MKVEREELDNCQVQLRVEAEPEEVEQSLQRAVRRVSSRTIVPGFRRGKAPPTMVERFVGREVLFEEALQDLVPRLTRQAIEEQQLRAVGDPEIEVAEREPVIFTARIPVEPRVELAGYRAFRFPKEPVIVEEERVESVLESLREQQATWQPVDRPLRFKDLVTVDYAGIIDGSPYLERQDYTFVMEQGDPHPAPGFAEYLEGAEKGIERSFDLKLPDDFPLSDAAGRTCHFQATVREVKEKLMPPLDDDFAKGVGQYENIQALEDRVRADLRERAEAAARRQIEENVMKALVEGSRIEMPPQLVEHEVDHLIEQEQEELRRRRERLEDYLQSLRKSPEEWREELRPVARQRLSLAYALEKVAEAEGLSVADEELEQEIERVVASSGDDADRVRRLYTAPALRDGARSHLLRRRVVDRLVDLATGAEESVAPAS